MDSITMQTQSTAGSSTGEKLIAAAKAIAPVIREAAGTIEQTKRLPQHVFEAIADAGLFLTMIPKAAGGYELDFPSFARILETVALADASAAWCVSQGSIFSGTYAARMPVAVARKLFIDTPRAVAANTPTPTAKAVVVEGGYRVTGRCGFSSGSPHAAWIAPQAQVVENGQTRMVDGKPQIIYCFVPHEQAEIHDSWKVRGMRGTGTNDFSVNDVFVPAERTVPYANAPVLHDGPVYKISRSLYFATGDALCALSCARNALEAFYELAGSKAPRYQTNLLRDLPATQFTVGKCEITLRSAHLYLFDAVQKIWDDTLANGTPQMESRTNLRIATTHAIHQAAEVVRQVYLAAGATVVFEGNVIQRMFQDVNVITQHVQARFQHYDTVGRYVLGVPFEEQHL